MAVDRKVGFCQNMAARKTLIIYERKFTFLQIWELIIDDSGKVEPNCLCDLNRHQNSVNVVRWSPNGKLLASGDTGEKLSRVLCY